jgi:putative oxidoreductase
VKGQPALGAALLRVMLGVIFVMHGYYALMVLGPTQVAGFTTRMGYPTALATPLAWYLIVAHFFGGFLMIIGLWTRWAALAQVPIMASAVFLLHLRQGFFMRGMVVDAGTGRAIAAGYEYALLVLVATVALVFLGPGLLSIDRR